MSKSLSGLDRSSFRPISEYKFRTQESIRQYLANEKLSPEGDLIVDERTQLVYRKVHEQLIFLGIELPFTVGIEGMAAWPKPVEHVERMEVMKHFKNIGDLSTLQADYSNGGLYLVKETKSRIEKLFVGSVSKMGVYEFREFKSSLGQPK